MTLTFILIRIMPGDPVETLAMDMVRTQGMNFEEAYKQAKAALNYDPRPHTETIYELCKRVGYIEFRQFNDLQKTGYAYYRRVIALTIFYCQYQHFWHLC